MSRRVSITTGSWSPGHREDQERVGGQGCVEEPAPAELRARLVSEDPPKASAGAGAEGEGAQTR